MKNKKYFLLYMIIILKILYSTFPNVFDKNYNIFNDFNIEYIHYKVNIFYIATFIFVVIIFYNKNVYNFSINLEKSNLKFFPFKMEWKTYIYIESKNNAQYNQISNEITTFLKNNNSISWGYSIEKMESKIVYKLIICKVNKIFPSKKIAVLNKVKGILLLAGIKDISISQIHNNNNNFKSYNIISDKVNISTENIVKSLQKINLSNFNILTKTRCVKISDYSSLIRYLKKLIRNKNQQYNTIFIDEKSSSKITSRYSRRVFGSNYNTITNMILNLFGAEANRDQRLYEYMLNELQIIDNSTNLKDSEFNIRLESILKKVHWELYIYEYEIKILVSKKQIDINFLSSIFEIFQYKITSSTSKINVTFSNQIWKILQFPKKYKIKIIDQNSISNNQVSPKNIIGYTKSENFKIFPVGLCVKDFSEGGLIAGAIGTGKTTLRLKIMKFLLDEKVRVIDFDIKGDASKYKILSNQGKVLIPGINFTINPFDCPANISYKSHSENLYSMFIETITEDEFTTPQKNLLFKAIYKTTQDKGNARQFIENILLISYQEQLVVDNKQDITAQSLIIKFNWMQFSLGSIFWKKTSSLNLDNYKNNSLFFDLSKLNQIATHDQIRFIVDIIMNNVMSSVNDFNPSNYKGAPKLIIFIDEAQIIMPKNSGQKLTKLEETLSTLRYKGVSIIATGISADLMSRILLDTNFVAQFRSESELLSRKLGLDKSDDVISKLSNYECIIKIKSMGILSSHISINDFQYNYNSDYNYEEKQIFESLDSFTINYISVLKIRIKSVFISHFILLNKINKQLELEANLFFKSEILPFIKNQQQNNISDLIELINIKYISLGNLNVLSQVVKEEPEQFILHVLHIYYLNLIENPLHYKNNTQNILISSVNKAIQLVKLQFIESNYNVTIDTISHFEVLYNRILNNKLVIKLDYIKFIEETKQLLTLSINSSIFYNAPIESNINLEEKIGIAYDLNIITHEKYLNYIKFINIFNVKIIADKNNIKLALIIANELTNQSVFCTKITPPPSLLDY